MGCNCGGGGSKKAALHYQVTFPNGSVQTFTNSSEANSAIRSAGGGTMRAVRP